MGHGSAKNEGNQSKKNTGGGVPTCTQKREFLHNPTPHPTTPFTQEALLYPASVPSLSLWTPHLLTLLLRALSTTKKKRESTISHLSQLLPSLPAPHASAAKPGQGEGPRWIVEHCYWLTHRKTHVMQVPVQRRTVHALLFNNPISCCYHAQCCPVWRDRTSCTEDGWALELFGVF